MPFTIPTIYALRAVTNKNIGQRLTFVKNFYKFKGSLFLLTLGYASRNTNNTLNYYDNSYR